MVDIDLEKFFDRVNHDILMARVAKRVERQAHPETDPRLPESGMMEGGLVGPTEEGRRKAGRYRRCCPT